MRRLCDRGSVRHFIILSVCVALTEKSDARIYLIFLPDRSCKAQSHGDFSSEIIRIDLHFHLEVAVAQQDYFGIKSTVAQKR